MTSSRLLSHRSDMLAAWTSAANPTRTDKVFVIRQAPIRREIAALSANKRACAPIALIRGALKPNARRYFICVDCPPRTRHFRSIQRCPS
jgi:hypothetical protein